MGDPAVPTVFAESPPQFPRLETVTVAVQQRAANSLSTHTIIMNIFNIFIDHKRPLCPLQNVRFHTWTF